MEALKRTLVLPALIVCLAVCLQAGCNSSTGPNPGGPAILVGAFQVSRDPLPGPVLVRVYTPTDYRWKLGWTSMPAATDSFRISNLPADTVDVIITSPNYFAAKHCNVALEEGQNPFEATLLDTCYLDHLGRPKWMPDIVLVGFKDIRVDSLQASAVLQTYDCVVLRYRDGPAFATVDIPDDRTVVEMTEILTMDSRLRWATPNTVDHDM